MLSLYKLRRLAPRAIRVAETHATLPGVVAMKEPVTLVAQDFMTQYDNAKTLEKVVGVEYSQGRNAMINLRDTVSELIPAINLHLPELPVNVTIRGIPDDIFESVSLLVDTLTDVEQKPEAITATIIPAIENALTTAENEWREAEVSRVGLQEAQRTLRATGESLNHHLKLFRRSLAKSLGRSHYDYKKLKDSAANTPEPEDPQFPESPSTPASPNTPVTPPTE